MDLRLWKNINKTRLLFGLVVLISTFLNLFRLTQVGTNGFGNMYYAATVQSMLTSLHHFFYLSFDPAGFISLDKPPLAFWLQAAMARLFGFHGLCLLLPSALAGITAVVVLYILVRRSHGETAALLAALALAVSPVNVVIDRNNAPDALMILSLLCAAWLLFRALEENSLRSLMLAAVLVGVAFNIKMLQIMLVIPAFVVLYLVASPWHGQKRLIYGATVLFLAVLVSSPWVLAVDLTPPNLRPYVGGSANNTVMNLIFNYNGLHRFWGEDFTYYSGAPGIFRLINDKLGGQIGWLIPLAFLGGGVAVWRLRQPTSPEETRQRNSLIFWFAWALTQVVYFSISIFFHRYYLATLAPAMAALFGIGVNSLWKIVRQGGKRERVFTAVILLVGICTQVWLLHPFPGWREWLIPFIVGIPVVSWGMFFILQRLQRTNPSLRTWCAFMSVGALLIAPLAWTLIPVYTCTNVTLPYAGPQVFEKQGCKPFTYEPFFKQAWLDALEQGRNGAPFPAATHDLGIAELGILQTGEPFLALGGYRGSDPILTVEQFAELVAHGEVRYYTALADKADYPVQEDIRNWVKAHCPPVTIDDKGILIWGPCKP
ncbi:MAG: glycosyltransferase family 39 protein [Anaerolineales bacterium]|nr:glycosyltransferase family 39 protein [Anaerolineales bacterium]